MRKRLLSPFVLLLLTFTLLNAPTGVYAVQSPYIAVLPSTIVDETLTPGESFTISIYTDYKGSDINGWQFTLSYDASILYGVKVTNGNLITTAKHPSATFLPGDFDNNVGELSLTGAAFLTLEPVPLTSGPGILANVTFTVVGTGTSDIILGPQTALFGYTEGGWGDKYYIVDGSIQRDHLGHGYFDNTVPPPETYPPVAVITAPEIAYINETVAFSGENSYDPDGGLIMSYSWDFGDGATATGVTTAHNYATLGTYTVTLVVTDEEEETSETAQHTLQITIRPIADLVKWKVKPEAHHWDESKDDDGNVSLTALARNMADIEVDVKVVCAILDAKAGGLAGPLVVAERTLEASPTDVPITVEFNPHNYGYDGTTSKVLYAQVTLSYYDPATETYIPTNPKIVRVTVLP